MLFLEGADLGAASTGFPRGRRLLAQDLAPERRSSQPFARVHLHRSLIPSRRRGRACLSTCSQRLPRSSPDQPAPRPQLWPLAHLSKGVLQRAAQEACHSRRRWLPAGVTPRCVLEHGRRESQGDEDCGGSATR